MKKALSIVLTVALLLAVVPMGLFGLTAAAETTEALGFKPITIGGQEYLIQVGSQSNARDTIANALAKTEYSDTQIELPSSAWSVEAQYSDWTLDKNFAYNQNSNLSRLSFEPWMSGWSHEIVIQDNGLVMNPGQNGATATASIALSYTAPKTGKVVLYDVAGSFKALKNSDPYYSWWADDRSLEVTIYNNGTQIWPANGESNVIDFNNTNLAFPDLGVIDVTAGDVLTVKFFATPKGQVHTLTDLEVAYVYESNGYKEITIGGNHYLIEDGSQFNARDTIANALAKTEYSDTQIELPASAWSIEAQYSDWALDKKFAYNQNSNLSRLSFEPWIGGWSHEIVIQDNGLVMNPGQNGATATASIALSYTAPKTGKVVLYDVAGSFKALKNSDPYYSWWADDRSLEVTIYNNGTQIWPANGESNVIDFNNTNLAFPDLGVIDVTAGDVLTVKFFATPKGQVHTLTDLEVAYVYEKPAAEKPENLETINIGGVNYPIYGDKIYTAYDSIISATEGLTPSTEFTKPSNDKVYTGPTVSFENTAWNVFAADIWDGTPRNLYIQEATPDDIEAEGRYQQIAFYNTNPYFGDRSVSIFREKLFVTPSHDWMNDSSTRPIEFNFTAKESGSVVLFDTEGKVYAPAVNDQPPFYSWTNNNRTVSFTILKNGVVIWPTNGEDNTIEAACDYIEFPNIGTISVNAGDVVTVAVSANKNRAGVYMSPAVAYVYEALGGSNEVTIGDSVYVIEGDGQSNARDTIANALAKTEYSDTQIELPSSAWSVEAQYSDWTLDKNFAYNQNSNLSRLSFEPWMSGWSHEIVIQDNGLVMNPGQNGATATASIALSYTAPKTGKVVLYDVAGSFKALKNSDPYYSWWADDRSLEVTIYNNGTQIWPANGESNVIDFNNTNLAFPDLGVIDVTAGDVLTVKFFATPKGQVHTLTDLEVAYIHEHSYSDAHDETCEGCGTPRAVEHDYDNECDVDCNVCGAERIVKHVYEDCADVDCNVCGAERVAPGHFVYADCALKCDVCGATVEPTAEHTYVPGCERYCYYCYYDRGGKVHEYDSLCDTTCEHCGETRTAPHNYGGDCDTECDDCGATREVAEDVLHTYDNGCDAECNACGYIREVGDHVAGNDCYTCGNCGVELDEPLHVDEDEDGLCDNCEEELDVSCEHTYDNACDADCNLCGEVREVGDHVYGDWIVDVEATTNKAGSKHRECSECGTKETEVIPMVFGFRGASLELQSSLGIIYTINADLVKVYGYTNIYATFEINGVTTTVTEYEFDSEKNIYRFKFRGLAPHVMNDNVVATLYGEKDGEVVTGVQPTYSVVGYCQNQLKKASNTATFKKFLVDTLKYGSKAQVYVKHNASVLAIDQIDEAYKALGTSELVSVVDNLNQEYKVIANATTVFRGASLYLEDSISVRYTFRVSEGVTVDDVSLKVSVPSVGNWTITSENFVEKSDSVGTYYQVDFAGLNPNHMKEIIYTTLCVDGVEASNTITYSIESYVARYSGSNTALREMIQAMMQYGESAIEYVAEQGK